jgi:phytoene dehydrogenase-like protein
MSGLAAAIRLAMAGKSVTILEQHSVPGGLNSYYQRGKRKLDVGLHAMTNYMEAGSKGKPLGKILKQLRLRYHQLELVPQIKSKIHFPNQQLSFSNKLEVLKQSIADQFPGQQENFEQLVEFATQFNETSLEHQFTPAKEHLSQIVTDPLLLDMLITPLLLYGSANEDEMDLAQFVIMFKSIYLEGFMRPQGGVRTIINLLLSRLDQLGVKIEYRSKVEEIISNNQVATAVRLTSGRVIKCQQIFSSIGALESERVAKVKERSQAGPLSFVESIFYFKQKPNSVGIDQTIIFYNNRPQFNYRCPDSLFDDQSSVVCFPNNFEQDDYNEGIVRVTFIANYHRWSKLSKDEYQKAKQEVAHAALETIYHVAPEFKQQPVFSDTFTPLTIERYTGHVGGAVYGSPNKWRDGKTELDQLYLVGTDQGFLGIVGSLLSGISIANLHGIGGGK